MCNVLFSKKLLVLTFCVCINTDVFGAQIVGSEITLCSDGYSANGTSCTSYAQNNCDSGYHDILATDAFIAPQETECRYATYKKQTLPDTTTYLIYNGILVGAEITLCSNGYSTNGSSCTTYSNGYCPNDYYDLNNGETTFKALNAGSCGSGYKTYNAESACGYSLSGSTCVDLCVNGLMTTDVGTCASLCSLGATTLRSSTGLIIPMWSEKQTTPSVNIGINDGVCYINLVPGTTSASAIMFEYDNNRYHTSN